MRQIKFEPGYRQRFWQRNCVAFREELGVSQETLAMLADLSIDTVRGHEHRAVLAE